MSNKRVNTAKWYKSQNRWQINVQKDGIRKSFYSSVPGRSGQRECNKKADAWLNSDIVNSSMRLDKFFYNEYIPYKKTSCTPSRVRTIETYYKNHIHEVIGFKKIKDLKRSDLQHVIDVAFKKGLAKSTIKQLLSTLSNIIKYARFNDLTALTCEFIQVPKKAHGSIEKRSLTIEEIKTLLTDETILYNRQIKPDRFINIYRFIFLTGLRRGECLALKWADVFQDINGNTIVKIERSINAAMEITDGKNINANREIMLNSYAVEILQKQKKLLKNLNIKGALVFPDTTKGGNSFINPHSFMLAYNRYANYHNFGAHTVHELRHSYISLNKDIDIKLLKSIVGHSDSLDTLKIYGHAFQEEKEKAAAVTADKISMIIN